MKSHATIGLQGNIFRIKSPWTTIIGTLPYGGGSIAPSKLSWRLWSVRLVTDPLSPSGLMLGWNVGYLWSPSRCFSLVRDTNIARLHRNSGMGNGTSICTRTSPPLQPGSVRHYLCYLNRTREMLDVQPVLVTSYPLPTSTACFISPVWSVWWLFMSRIRSYPINIEFFVACSSWTAEHQG